MVKLLAESYVSCTTREYRKEPEVVRGNTAVVMGTGAGIVETTAILLEVVIGLVVDGLMTTLELVVARTVLDVSGVLEANVVALTLLEVVATLLASVVAVLEVGLPFVELGAGLVAVLEVVALTLLEVAGTVLVEAVAALLIVLDVTAAAFVVVVCMAVELVVPLGMVAIGTGWEDPGQMYRSGVTA